MSDRYNEIFKTMESSILECLESLENGYGYRKCYISQQTGIQIDILTVFLKRLKERNEVVIMKMFSEENLLANGSGYCLPKHQY